MKLQDISCLDYVYRIGLDRKINLKEKGDYYSGNSPFDTPKNKPSFTIYKNRTWYFNDYRGHKSGNVIQLCAELNHNGDKWAARREIEQLFGLDLEKIDSEVIKKQKKLPDNIDYWQKELVKNKPILNYITERLGDKAGQTIRECAIGFSSNRNRIIIPYYQNGRPIYFTGRINPEINENPKYWKPKKEEYGETPCWGYDSLFRDKPLIISEGTFDALTFYQEGYAVLSPFTTQFSKSQEEDLIFSALEKQREGQEVFIIFDNDQAGRDATEDLARALFEKNINFKVITNYGEEGEDVSSYYQNHGYSIQNIFDHAQEGLLFIASLYKNDPEEFRRYVLKHTRRMSNPRLAEIFDKLNKTEYFNEAFLKELFKECKACPLEKIICDEIKEAHQIIHLDNLGFYEYEKDIWKKKTDISIESQIDQRLDKFATGNRLSSIVKLLRAKTYAEVELNKKRIMVFKNGTLELDSGTFRSSRSEDYTSIQLSYEYDPEAQCPRWIQFVDEIMSHDRDKIALLQEVTGYCLFPENSLQSCAFLKGGGGNGKSVYLNAVTELFGGENTSNVSLSDFSNANRRIEFKDCLLNISHEEKTSMVGHEVVAEFKKFVAGDIMNGCFKFKDFINFKPHAKLLISANDFIKMPGVDEATKRRIKFIGFNEFFKTEPDSEEVHKADIYLPEKLRKELPGIFNWAYEGYLRLKKNGHFTVSEEHLTLMAEFIEDNDSVIAFLNECIPAEYMSKFKSKDKISYSTMYSRYQQWCDENGRSPVAQQAFSRKVGDNFPKIAKGLKDFKEFNDRYKFEKYRGAFERGIKRVVIKTKEELQAEEAEAKEIAKDPDLTPM